LITSLSCVAKLFGLTRHEGQTILISAVSSTSVPGLTSFCIQTALTESLSASGQIERPLAAPSGPDCNASAKHRGRPKWVQVSSDSA
jgi:hypothetical protein